MFKVNKKEACLFLGVCGPMTVINACSGKSKLGEWKAEVVEKWLKDNCKLKDDSNKDDNDEKLKACAKGIIDDKDINDSAFNDFIGLYKGKSDGFKKGIIHVGNNAVEGNDPKAGDYEKEQKGYILESSKDNGDLTFTKFEGTKSKKK